MIDEKDLMVGDFVCYDKANGYITKVIDIQRYGVVEIGYKYTITAIRDKRDPLYSGYEEHFNVQILNPIGITDEVLEKNGFTVDGGYCFMQLDENSYLEYYFHEHRLRKWWHGTDEWQNHSDVKDITFQCHCHYVHELQNALRFSKIKKEIEL
jgi:hypothetical protein